MWRLWNTGTKELGQRPSWTARAVPTTAVVVPFLSHLELFRMPRGIPQFFHAGLQKLSRRGMDTELLRDPASDGGRSWGACDAPGRAADGAWRWEQGTAGSAGGPGSWHRSPREARLIWTSAAL